MQGLISVDRSSKATQPLTIPRPIQVVCKGSSSAGIAKLGRAAILARTFYVPQETGTVGAGNAQKGTPKGHSPATHRGYTSSLSSVDSDLEAFSHNPADGSFAPLAFQPSANAKCLNQRFLSY